MEFYIPLCRDELLKQKPSNEYYVRELYDEAEINERIKEFGETLDEKGPVELIEYFDVYFSALRNFQDIKMELRANIWDSILVCHQLHFNDICAFLQEELNIDDRAASIDNRRDHRNTLQMNVYLLTQFAECFENHVLKSDQNNVSITGKGKRGRKAVNNRQESDSENWYGEWIEQKSRLLQNFVKLMRQPLNLLWDPPIIDEQFVNCVGNICYKVFENPEAGKARTNNDDAIELLGILISNYRHHSTAGIKIVQQLQHFEHLSSFWSNAVAKFVAEHHSQNVVLEIFRELASTELDDLAKEGASARSYASFLIDLAEKSPTVVLANISLLMSHLDAECYTMRNGVITILAELIIKKLQGEHLGESERQNRDKFLDRLEIHLHDKNAFCRSKCMQMWTKMCEQNCIPKSRLKTLLPLVIGRLVDKGSTVRKGAIQLLTSILRNNPYMAKLSLDEMQAKYETEKEKLAKMLTDKQPTDEESKEREIIRNADQMWSKISVDVEDVIDDWIGTHFHEGTLDTSTCMGDLDCDVMLKAIFSMLIEGEYAQACGFAVLARHTWPEHRVFQIAIDSEDILPSSLEDIKRRLVECLKMIYLEHVVAQGLAGVKKKRGDSEDVDVDEFDDDDEEEDDEDKQLDTDTPEIQQQRRLVRFLRDTKIFVEQLQTVLPQVSMMLRQTQTSDVLESIEFVATCAEFGVNGAKAAVWKCCSLIWSKEASVKESVVKTFQRLYLTVSNELDEKLKYASMAQNLIDLVINANLSQRTCLEDVVCEMMKHKFIHAEVLQILWEKFAGKNVDESKAALKVLGMAAKAEKSIVKDNFDLLVQRGLGEKARKDFELVCDTCVALEKLGVMDNRKDEEIIKQEPFRLPSNSLVFTKLQSLLIEGFTCIDDPLWTPMMEHAVKVIFLLAEHPDLLSGHVLKSIFDIVKHSPVNNCLMTRFVSLIGQSALQTFIHVDVAVCRELKRRNLIREQAKIDRDEKKYKRKSLLATPRSTVSKIGAGDHGCDEEIALAGASADDVEWEYVNKLCEEEILSDDTLLGKLSKIVIDVCKHQQKYNNADLQASAALALSKLMIVSSKFCESQLPLLFTLLDRSELACVRANIIISLGDLSFRFPNLIEPWTSTVYKRLNDRDLNVRLNCLLVLNHLILNDMIKPKGHVADIALCTLDGSPQVASLAKKFFVEYSEKGNALYNLLPDIISRLSDSETKIDGDDFKVIMKLLFSLIHKERQFESLVEKLCQRFQGTRSVEQWRFYSYCLSLPPYNDRCLKKLNENLSCFSSQLGDKEVFNNFISIINAAKKSAKIESKPFVEELEAKFQKLHTKTSEDDEMAAKATATNAVKVPSHPIPKSVKKEKKSS